MNPAAETVEQFKKVLINLDKIMKTAAGNADQRKFDLDVLFNARLAPDMFALDGQVQAACDVAKFCAAYLAEKPAPAHEDNEETYAQLHERIGKVVTFLESFKPEDFANAMKVQVKPKWAKGQWIHTSDYIQEVAIPNFYFHVSMAYAILRHNGAPIGKMDFLGSVKMQGVAQT